MKTLKVILIALFCLLILVCFGCRFVSPQPEHTEVSLDFSEFDKNYALITEDLAHIKDDLVETQRTPDELRRKSAALISTLKAYNKALLEESNELPE